MGCKECLRPFLPAAGAVHGDDAVSLGENKTDSIGKVKSFYGNFLVVIRALTYILSLGKEGIPQASKSAVLNANYLMRKMVEGGLGKYLVFDEICMRVCAVHDRAESGNGRVCWIWPRRCWTTACTRPRCISR